MPRTGTLIHIPLYFLWYFDYVVVVQPISHIWLFVTPRMAAHQACLSFTISQSLLKPMSIELVMPSSHLILCHSLLLLPSISPSIRIFSTELILCIRWSKYWGFSFSISPSNEYSGLISFRMDWFDLLAVQGTESLLQHHDFKSIQNSSVLSLLDGPTLTSLHNHWKNHNFDYMDLCWQSDVSLFNTLSCHSFHFKEQASFTFMAAGPIRSDFGAQENKICHCFPLSPIYLLWSDGTRCHDLSFLNVEL